MSSRGIPSLSARPSAPVVCAPFTMLTDESLKRSDPERLGRGLPIQLIVLVRIVIPLLYAQKDVGVLRIVSRIRLFVSEF